MTPVTPPLQVAATAPVSWRLLWLVVTPYWAFMLVSRMLTFTLATALDTRIIIAPPHLRALQHLLLLPLLIVFLRYAVAIGWPARQRLRAALLHVGMAAIFAFIARPILVGLVASDQSNQGLLDELFRSIISPNLSLLLWISTIGDFLLSYLGALWLLLGVQRYLATEEQLRRARGLETEWMRSRLNALQLRGNPHFVVNVLRDAARDLATRPAESRELLLRLSRLLQRSLASGGEELVPIRQELDAAREYLDIQSLRFPGHLRCDIDLDDAARDCLVPSLVLQPIVEDVLVRSQQGPAALLAIRVAARRTARGLDIVVSSDAPADDARATRHNATIELMRERLHALFGDRQPASIDADDSQACGIRLSLPFNDGATGPRLLPAAAHA